MNNRTTRITMMVVLVCSFAVPLAIILFTDTRYGAILLLIGFVTAFRTIRLWRALGRDEDDPERQRRANYRQDQSRTIFVPLLDEMGIPLDTTTANVHLQQARLQAGPRDMVVGVQRKPSEVQQS